MKILIVCFSGTGNTAKIADKYAAAFADLNAEVTLFHLPCDESACAEELNNCDLLGIGYPIHAFNAPANVLAFIKSINKLQEEKRAFIFKSSGEPVRMSDVSSLKLIKLLRKRNIKVTNEYQYCMPYNMIFRHSDEMAYRMWTAAQSVIPADCREILSGKTRLPAKMFLGGFLAAILRIEHPGAHLIGRSFKVTDKCVHCGLCVKNCPAHNITVTEKGKYKFGKKCLLCVRCSFNCPQNAIKIGLLNGWKVNGKYSFDKPDPAKEQKPDKHDKYCKKAYDRYFDQIAERLQNSTNFDSKEL